MKTLLLLAGVVVFMFCMNLTRNSASTNDFNQGQNTKTDKQFLNPKDLNVPVGFTHVVTANPGRMIFVAGQVPVNKQGEVVGKGDFRAQTTQVFENLKIALAAAGASFADVVKINTYVVNHKPADVTIFREVRSKYVSKEKPPASTFVGVSSLAREEFLIEIEAIAMIDQ